MARRRTLGKQYYKNRQKNYNISKIKRVKRIKTKTRKLGRGRGFLSSFRRAQIVPLSFPESQKEAVRNHKQHMDQHIKTIIAKVQEIEKLYNDNDKFFSTIEGFNKHYVRFIVNIIRPKLKESPDTYRAIDIDRGDIETNQYVRTFMEIWQGAENLVRTINAAYNNPHTHRYFYRPEQTVLSEISRLLNIIKDNSNALGPNWDRDIMSARSRASSRASSRARYLL